MISMASDWCTEVLIQPPPATSAVNQFWYCPLLPYHVLKSL
jgi:hypothetical protein